MNNTAVTTATYPLSTLGVLAISGQEAKKFLQGQATCDVNRLSPQRALLGALCNIKGRAYASFYLLETPAASEPSDAQAPHLLLIMPRAVIAATLSTLTKYSLFFKATLKDVSDRYTLTGTTEQHKETPPQDAYSVCTTDAGGWSMQLPSLLLNPPHRRQLILTPLSPIQAADSKPTIHCRDAAWRCLDIQHGTLLIDQGMQEAFIPLELNYGAEALQGVHFDKGCYTGQEIVARLHYRGASKYQLITAKATLPTLPSATLSTPTESLTPTAITLTPQTDDKNDASTKGTHSDRSSSIGKLVTWQIVMEQAQNEPSLYLAALIKPSALPAAPLQTEAAAQASLSITLSPSAESGATVQIPLTLFTLAPPPKSAE